jgi:hypothetical protein
MIPAIIQDLTYFGIFGFGLMLALLKVAALEAVILILYFAEKYSPKEEISS